MLGECCECNIVYTDQETGETTIAHSLLTWKQISPGSQSSHHHNLHTTHSVQESNGGHVSGSVQGESGDSSVLLDRTNLDCTVTSTDGNAASQPTAAGCNDAAPTTTIPVDIAWKTCSVSKSESLPPPHGRGCYVVRLCPTGRVSAVAINHTNAVDTHVLFTDLLNEVSLSVPVYSNRSDVMTGRYVHTTCMSHAYLYAIASAQKLTQILHVHVVTHVHCSVVQLHVFTRRAMIHSTCSYSLMMLRKYMYSTCIVHCTLYLSVSFSTIEPSGSPAWHGVEMVCSWRP